MKRSKSVYQRRTRFDDNEDDDNDEYDDEYDD